MHDPDGLTGGPLAGVRVVELAGIGPGPFATMLMADLGADVVRVDRPVDDAAADFATRDIVNRGKRSIAVDVRSSDGLAIVRGLVDQADVFVEGNRPGVAERLGLGPDELRDSNPRLVYARMTGWGQDGPLAQTAGHDIDYIALTGLLWATGRAAEAPVAPLNLLGDYAGGSMFLAVGVLAALLERERSGQGQVIDAAMVDGANVLSTMFTALSRMGHWNLSERGSNPLDSGAPWYDVYECADGRWIAVGALEPQFYAQLVELTGFRSHRPADRFAQPGPPDWSALKQEWSELWRTRPRDEWTDLLSSTDACVQPVLDWAEREVRPHLIARGSFVDVDGVRQPAPAPRFSRSALASPRSAPRVGEHNDRVLDQIRATSARLVSTNGGENA
jgi:alpha-methylacyl-CoA racemase